MEKNINNTSGALKLNKDAPGGEESKRWNSAAFFMLCLSVVLSCVAYGAVDPWAFGFLSLFSGLIVIFWIIDGWKNKELVINTNLILIPLVGIILLGLIQLLPLRGLEFSTELLPVAANNTLSLDPYSTRLALIKYTIFLVIFASALTFVNTPKRLSKIVYTLIIFAGLMAFYGILQDLAKAEAIYGLRPVIYGNLFASYVNKHHFAALMEMTIALTLGLLFMQATKKDKLLLLIIAVLLMGIAIVMTGSRGGFLSLVGILFFLVLLTVIYGDKKHSEEKSFLSRKNLIVVGSSFLLVLVLFGITVWLGAGADAVRSVGLEGSNPNDFTNGRLHFWTVTLDIIRNNPIIGSGLDSYGISFPQYDSWNGQFRLEHAHNDYLQTLSDSGIIGFGLLIMFIVLLFKQGLNVIRTSNDRFRRGVAMGALAGCFGVLIHSLFDFPLRTNSNSLFFLVLAAIAVNDIKFPTLVRRKIKVRRKKKITKIDQANENQ